MRELGFVFFAMLLTLILISVIWSIIGAAFVGLASILGFTTFSIGKSIGAGFCLALLFAVGKQMFGPKRGS